MLCQECRCTSFHNSAASHCLNVFQDKAKTPTLLYPQSHAWVCVSVWGDKAPSCANCRLMLTLQSRQTWKQSSCPTLQSPQKGGVSPCCIVLRQPPVTRLKRQPPILYLAFHHTLFQSTSRVYYTILFERCSPDLSYTLKCGCSTQPSLTMLQNMELLSLSSPSSQAGKQSPPGQSSAAAAACLSPTRSHCVPLPPAHIIPHNGTATGYL